MLSNKQVERYQKRVSLQEKAGEKRKLVIMFRSTVALFLGYMKISVRIYKLNLTFKLHFFNDLK